MDAVLGQTAVAKPCAVAIACDVQPSSLRAVFATGNTLLPLDLVASYALPVGQRGRKLNARQPRVLSGSGAGALLHVAHEPVPSA